MSFIKGNNDILWSEAFELTVPPRPSNDIKNVKSPGFTSKVWVKSVLGYKFGIGGSECGIYNHRVSNIFHMGGPKVLDWLLSVGSVVGGMIYIEWYKAKKRKESRQNSVKSGL